MPRYSVYVGNVGCVYVGRSRAAADIVFGEYANDSESGHGRAAGESVTMMQGDNIVMEHTPKPPNDIAELVRVLARELDAPLGDSGGGVMVGYKPLPDGRILCVSSDSIGLYQNEAAYYDGEAVAFVELTPLATTSLR